MFAGSTAMTAISVDPANQYYNSIDGVLYNKANTTIIQYPCGKVGEFTVPSNVTSVGFAFAYCVGLTAIRVDPANQYYNSIDGVLYNKANTTLVQYPLAMTGNYVIPENTTAISAYSFYHCNSLTALTLPINLTYIDDDAFRNCTYLSSVTMQGNVTHLGFQSFSNDSVLTSISFFGTVAASWVGYNWEIGDNAGLLGHALAASTFPAPGSYFYGLTMGSYLLRHRPCRVLRRD